MDVGSPVISDKTIIGMISYVPQNDTDLKAVMINMKIVSSWIEYTTSILPKTFITDNEIHKIVYKHSKNDEDEANIPFFYLNK